MNPRMQRREMPKGTTDVPNTVTSQKDKSPHDGPANVLTTSKDKPQGRPSIPNTVAQP